MIIALSDTESTCIALDIKNKNESQNNYYYRYALFFSILKFYLMDF